MKNILLVEDNPSFAAVATKYLEGQPYTKVHPARDYEQAMHMLRTQKFDGAFIDCFFPKQTGSNDISLGKSLVDRLANSDSHEVAIRSQLKGLAGYIDLKDPQLTDYTRLYLETSKYDFIPQEVVLSAIRILGSLSVFASTFAAKRFMKRHEERREKDEFHPQGDHYGSLLSSMERSETNQPLGILIAEESETLKIPFVLTTSAYHHGIGTQPLYDYAIKKRWVLRDSLPIQKNAKETIEFWAIALGNLGKPFHLRG